MSESWKNIKCDKCNIQYVYLGVLLMKWQCLKEYKINNSSILKYVSHKFIIIVFILWKLLLLESKFSFTLYIADSDASMNLKYIAIYMAENANIFH